jgi:hypothetical protein
VRFSCFLPSALFHLFNGAGVFDGGGAKSANEWRNVEYVIYGLSGTTNNWYELNILDNYFPYSQGEKYLRLSLFWHGFLGQAAQNVAYKDLLNKIQMKYNKTHMDKPVHRLALYQASWPYSEKSWNYYKTKKETVYSLIYIN